jgi:RNA polymerase sigma-70 factor, ECF subfamily
VQGAVGDLRHLTARANGQPAVGWYVWEPRRNGYAAAALEVLAIEGSRVQEITAFAFPELFARFGLPTFMGPRAAFGSPRAGH